MTNISASTWIPYSITTMELNPKGLLMQSLDASLQAKAEELMEPRDNAGHPLIGNIYALQCIAEMHIYLMNIAQRK